MSHGKLSSLRAEELKVSTELNFSSCFLVCCYLTLAEILNNPQISQQTPLSQCSEETCATVSTYLELFFWEFLQSDGAGLDHRGDQLRLNESLERRFVELSATEPPHSSCYLCRMNFFLWLTWLKARLQPESRRDEKTFWFLFKGLRPGVAKIRGPWIDFVWPLNEWWRATQHFL